MRMTLNMIRWTFSSCGTACTKVVHHLRCRHTSTLQAKYNTVQCGNVFIILVALPIRQRYAMTLLCSFWYGDDRASSRASWAILPPAATTSMLRNTPHLGMSSCLACTTITTTVTRTRVGYKLYEGLWSHADGDDGQLKCSEIQAIHWTPSSAHQIWRLPIRKIRSRKEHPPWNTSWKTIRLFPDE